MTETRYRLKKLEKDNGGGTTPFIILFHDEQHVFRDHEGDVYLHVANDMWQNQRTDDMVLSTIFLREELRGRI
jgi:hypothetical protein